MSARAEHLAEARLLLKDATRELVCAENVDDVDDPITDLANLCSFVAEQIEAPDHAAIKRACGTLRNTRRRLKVARAS